MQELFERFLSGEFEGLICLGSILLLVVSTIMLKILSKFAQKKSKEKIEEIFTKMNFSPDVKIDFRTKSLGERMSYLIDEKSKQIALYILGSKAYVGFVKFSEIEDVHIKINDEAVIQNPMSFVDVKIKTYINSIYLYIDTNKLSQPVYKWGYKLEKPIKKDDQYAKDLIDWYYKVYASIKQIMKLYGKESQKYS